MTALDDLRSAQGEIEGFNPVDLLGIAAPLASGAIATEALKSAIRDALSPPGPAGNPAAIEATAQAYHTAAARCGRVSADIGDVATGKLPTAWRGAAAENAAQAVAALGAEVTSSQRVLDRAAVALSQWAGDLRVAQTHDSDGITQLNDVLNTLNNESLWDDATGGSSAAKNAAANGVNARIAAAQYAQDRAHEPSSTLNQLASQARAERITSPNVDALTSVELATRKDQNGTLLTETQLERASRRLDGMSPADRASFERMLAGAKSPLEAAYLWQALGAGHSVAQVQSFDAAIHPHGGDQAWLTEHLTPDMSIDKYKRKTFDQGTHLDCVSASTIIAQAQADPVLMLYLTTGGTANGDDSKQQFEGRLQNMYLSQYVEGQRADGDSSPSPDSTSGIGPTGETKLANQDLGAVTGSHYQYQNLGGASDRAGVIDQINQAVDSGKPVPVDVTNGNEGHQLMIIGRDGDRLEVYNPWGSTGWVTDSQFVNGQLGSLTDPSHRGPPGGIPTPYGVELPQ